MKPVGFMTAVAVACVLIPLASKVAARSAYNAIMTYQYNLREDKNLRSTCLYCHSEADGGDLWNPFGTLMRDVFRKEGGRRVPETLFETLKRDLDSDEDGYRDILEVVGKSFPGDPKSVPTLTIVELEAKLEAMGGLDAFKPEFTR